MKAKMKAKMKVTVNNVPKRGCERYVVARVSEGELWYWGSWKKLVDAQMVALEMEGIILEYEEAE